MVLPSPPTLIQFSNWIGNSRASLTMRKCSVLATSRTSLSDPSNRNVPIKSWISWLNLASSLLICRICLLLLQPFPRKSLWMIASFTRRFRSTSSLTKLPTRSGKYTRALPWTSTWKLPNDDGKRESKAPERHGRGAQAPSRRNPGQAPAPSVPH